MANQTGSTDDDLIATQERLKSAHAKLVKEFDKLHSGQFSAVGHREYLEKLKAHLLALEAHTAAIRAQHDELHHRREALHEQHEAEALERASRPHKPRGTRSR